MVPIGEILNELLKLIQDQSISKRAIQHHLYNRNYITEIANENISGMRLILFKCLDATLPWRN